MLSSDCRHCLWSRSERHNQLEPHQQQQDQTDVIPAGNNEDYAKLQSTHNDRSIFMYTELQKIGTDAHTDPQPNEYMEITELKNIDTGDNTDVRLPNEYMEIIPWPTVIHRLSLTTVSGVL